MDPSTRIKTKQPVSWDDKVKLVVYDIWGREVARLVDGYQDAGYHSIVFDASHLPSREYLYRLQAVPFVASDQITLLK